jgi:hypothetical protein
MDAKWSGRPASSIPPGKAEVVLQRSANAACNAMAITSGEVAGEAGARLAMGQPRTFEVSPHKAIAHR